VGEPRARAIEADREILGRADSRERTFRLLRRSLLAVLWIAGATWLQIARQQGVPATDSIWAEDGHLFLTAALNYDHPVSLLVAPAGGYMHAVPRTLATIASVLSLDSVASYLSIVSAALVAALSVFVFVASKRFIPSAVARAVLSGTMAVLPAAAYEAANNTANLHYYLIFACFWALLFVPGSWGGAAMAGVVALAAAASDPLSGILIPLGVWPLIRRADVRRIAIAVAFLVGLSAQAYVVLVGDRPHRYADPSVPAAVQAELAIRSFAPRTYDESHAEELPELYGLRVAGSFLVGDRLLEPSWRSWDGAFAFASLAVVLGLGGYGFSRRDIHRGTVPLTLAYSVAFFVLPVAIRGTDHVAPVGEAVSYAGSRYVVVPVLLLMSMALVIFGTRDSRVARFPWRVIQAGLLIGLGAVVLTNYPADNLRSLGPSWSTELVQARTACAGEPGGYARIKVSPPMEKEGFNVLVSCRRVA
jgi:hypothetical protein